MGATLLGKLSKTEHTSELISGYFCRWSPPSPIWGYQNLQFVTEQKVPISEKSADAATGVHRSRALL
jgi:hypothetical protein